jgi:hypothetical protein
MQLEKTIQKLKKKKNTPGTKRRSKRKEDSSGLTIESDKPSPPHALPATEPIFTFYNGIEHLSFQYSVKGTIKEIEIRIDIESIDLDKIDDQFKKENCLYPRANLPREDYIGNRWEYETQCNILGWKLAYLNMKELDGKRGLLQRAVDSLRNRYPGLRSRRVIRLEKLQNGTLRRRTHREALAEKRLGITRPTVLSKKPKAFRILPVETLARGVVKRHRFKVCDNIDVHELDYEFKRVNAVYPRALVESREMYQGHRWEMECCCNEIAWRLAWGNQGKLAGKKGLLQRAVDAYRARFTDIRPRRGRITNTIQVLLQNMQRPPEEVVDSPDSTASPSQILNDDRLAEMGNAFCDAEAVNPPCDPGLQAPTPAPDPLLFPDNFPLPDDMALGDTTMTDASHQALLDVLEESAHFFT